MSFNLLPFLHSKESACNARDLSLIPGLRRSPEEGYGYPLQYSCLEKFTASLLAQMVKHWPAMQETWVQSLGGEHLLEKGLATHSSILAWRIPWTEESGGVHTVHGVTDMTSQLNRLTFKRGQ